MANPYASVVICTRGTPTKVIQFLRDQTFRDFEIIIATEKGMMNAMNSALKQARGDIFVRVDDDVKIPSTWLALLVGSFKDHDVAGVTGPTYVPKERRAFRDSIRWAENPKGLLKWLYDGNEFKPGGIRRCGCVSYDSNYQERFLGRGLHLPFECDHLEGTNWAMRTDLIRKVGGYDPKFDGVCEWFDTDIEQKVKKLGYRFLYNPYAYLYHLLEQGDHYNERFDGFGRIKNFIRFNWRHARWRFFEPKFYIYLIIWFFYFVGKRLRLV